MKGLSMEFDEMGGYDCMTGAWVISRADGRPLLSVDQGRYGQESCDHDYRSPEAERIATICYEALLRAEDAQ